MTSESTSSHQTTAEFSIDLTPADGLLEATGRFDFTKTWSGGMQGSSRGVMLSAGDPQSGNAGYVALEVFDGIIDGHRGQVALHQFGSMNQGGYELRYELVPGTGTAELAGITGAIDLVIDAGTHRVTVRYAIDQAE
ncbi:MAG: DUF3224 domain-containing protein [Kineosporiaceae bacterium]|nr:DUF3224 domain-containing protein [Kineosporiaceae bacterium]MBK7624792.1 DUF3224 domain-containing protein [Kineosporiaceae bacterium]MBK8076831.1 DUF3224 domain-containing protein [Kineosporiaceae bacterium]